MLPVSEGTELGSSNQEASPSAVKNTGVVFVPCSHMEVHPYSFSSGVDRGPWVSFVTTDDFSVTLKKKLFQGLVSHELTAKFSIFNLFKLNEICPYYIKHVNQIIFNHITL